MLLIYGKGKVGNGVARLCDLLSIDYEIRDDSDTVDYSRYDAIIPSPGVPSHHDVYKSPKVKCELDFAYGYLPKDFCIIAVTGTDGKSTTSWILYEVLRKEYGDDQVYLSGNFDVPFSSTVREILEKNQLKGYIVVEVSSFMAYGIGRFEDSKESRFDLTDQSKPNVRAHQPTNLPTHFSPDYSIFTNFKPDHLNWHRDLQDYLDAKMNLLYYTKHRSIVFSDILDFARERSLSIDLPENVRLFGNVDTARDMRMNLNDRVDGEDIIVSGAKCYTLGDTQFSGVHNALNILATVIVCDEIGISPIHTREHLREITGLPHRIERVTERGGVTFIDDSKSTSCQSLIAALTAFPSGETILIAGGSDKGDPFDGLEESIKGLKYVVLIGATREILAKKCQLAGVAYSFAEGMDMAVEIAWKSSRHGDTILLSPGCASFGLFRDYLDRAEKFREAIKKLP